MKNWQVQIIGHPYGLEDIFDNQASESWSIVKDIDQFYLVSSLFNDLEDIGDVRDLAPEILNLLNGSAKLRISGFRRIEAGNVSYIDEEGHRRNFVLLQGSVTARSKVRAAAIAVTPEWSETA